MRLPALVAALLLANAAASQAPVLNPQRFAPLDVGNRWEYTIPSNSGTGPVGIGYAVTTADSETTIGGAPYTLISRQSFGATAAPTSARTVCAYSRTLGPGRFDAVAESRLHVLARAAARAPVHVRPDDAHDKRRRDRLQTDRPRRLARHVWQPGLGRRVPRHHLDLRDRDRLRRLPWLRLLPRRSRRRDL